MHSTIGRYSYRVLLGNTSVRGAAGSLSLPSGLTSVRKGTRSTATEAALLEGSLIPQTLQELDSRDVEKDVRSTSTSSSSSSRKSPKGRDLLHSISGPSFEDFVNEAAGNKVCLPYVKNKVINVFQVNIGLYCNQVSGFQGSLTLFFSLSSSSAKCRNPQCLPFCELRSAITPVSPTHSLTHFTLTLTSPLPRPAPTVT
jgi:hypothetical protein